MRKQSGFSIIMAIFLIVVLGGIAVFIGRVSSMQTHSSALDEEGSMAYQVAKTGIEWGIYQAIVGSSCAASTAITLAMPITALSTVNYTVTVTCTSTQATEGLIANNVTIYQITATAINAAGGNFRVERQLQATVSR
jgi:MSHA biogenesis protein MshP